LLADYQKKHRNVGQEADAILRLARGEGEAFAQETRASLKDMLERRTQQAEDKIARAEAQAVDEVRAAAIELAVAAAEKILREKASGAGGVSLIDQSIRELKGRLN
jgi:F-type H+-transporting ATPase subunit b